MKTKILAIGALILVLGATLGTHFMAAQESFVRGQRASLKQLKDHFANHSVLTSTAARSVNRSIRELRSLAKDLEDGGRPNEAMRLSKVIDSIVSHAEMELVAKRALVATLNEEIDEIKQVVSQQIDE